MSRRGKERSLCRGSVEIKLCSIWMHGEKETRRGLARDMKRSFKRGRVDADRDA